MSSAVKRVREFDSIVSVGGKRRFAEKALGEVVKEGLKGASRGLVRDSDYGVRRFGWIMDGEGNARMRREVGWRDMLEASLVVVRYSVYAGGGIRN